MTLSLLKSNHITAGYASFETDQYHGTGMPVSFSYFLTLTSPMGTLNLYSIEWVNSVNPNMTNPMMDFVWRVGIELHFFNKCIFRQKNTPNVTIANYFSNLACAI